MVLVSFSVKCLVQKETTLNNLFYRHLLGNDKSYHPAPWINGHLQERQPSYIWYWMREGPYETPRSCMEVYFRGLQTNPVSGKLL